MGGMPADLVVRSAGFAPVKGMRHRPVPRLELDERGAVGDRAWCLVDVGARRVLRTVQHPSLMGVVATVDDGHLALTLPDGASVDGVAGGLGRDDRLRLLGPVGRRSR